MRFREISIGDRFVLATDCVPGESPDRELFYRKLSDAKQPYFNAVSDTGRPCQVSVSQDSEVFLLEDF